MALNNDVIRLLPDSVANQIAAGEVIQRPASVVKELVENSIDAGATTVEIIVKDAGKTLIQVVDDGIGMSPTDARMAFERHATSKISNAGDLQTLHTMGFRGEALASIAAVAQVDMRTMRKCDKIGTRLMIAGAKVEGQEATACAPGTNMMVKNLFAYVPARRKFLKKDAVELNHIIHEFERLALVNTQVDFSLISNDVTLHQLHRSTLKSRITALFGKSLDHQLLPIETETTIVRLTGFVGLPQFARKRGALQYFFVNGRNMIHNYFRKAVQACYAELIPVDAQPNFFINLEVDPDRIDVNIHPQKHEIKFEDEQAIWQVIHAAVKEALGKSNATGAIDFNADDVPDIPLFQPDVSQSMPSTGADVNYNPFTPTSGMRAGHVDRDWQKLYESFISGQSADAVPGGSGVGSKLNSGGMADLEYACIPDLTPGPELMAPQSAGVVSLHNRYLISPSKSGLMVIDRHRAHVRVLYQRFFDYLSAGNITTQTLLFPVVIELTPAGSVSLQACADELEQLGFDIAYLGDNSWNISAVPAMAADVDASSLIEQLVEQLQLTANARESLIQPLALSMARAIAVRSDDIWTQAQNEALLSDLLQVSTPDYTPDGLPIIGTITDQQIQNLFL